MKHVCHLQEVDGLSILQVVDLPGFSRKKTTHFINKGGIVRKQRKSILDDYTRLIEDWYETYPSLKATRFLIGCGTTVMRGIIQR